MSESRTISSEATSLHRSIKGRGAFEGEVQDGDILIDIDEVFAGLEVLQEFGTQRRSIRPRFPSHQAEANARTRTIEASRTLSFSMGKDHPSTPVMRGEVCCISLLVIQILVICMF